MPDPLASSLHQPPNVMASADAPTASEGERTLVDRLLDEQRQLTAVEAFARSHERHGLTEPHYRKLLPASAPRPGEQYAFEVDLDKCSGCKACVTACHSLNGLDEGEAWREVGVLYGEILVPVGRDSVEPHFERSEASGASISGEARFARTTAGGFDGSTESRPAGLGNRVVPLEQIVTTACHHCVEPGCLEGCPVLAYDKDPVTGIVRHLDDQCIGCSYCILKCPYDVPKYSATRGIVRKCDMCHGRLAAGEAPACVQACPNEAIRISVVSQTMIAEEVKGLRVEELKREETASAAASTFQPFNSLTLNAWLPDSPSATITLPTTRYVSKKPAADLRASDHSLPKPQHPHWPLILMLVLTQAGIGGLLVDLATRPTNTVEAALWSEASARETIARIVTSAVAAPLPLVSLALLFAGLTASVFHLGQPLKAWRVWLGWRTSWLSREAMALNAFAGAAVLSVASRWLPPLTNYYSLITSSVFAIAIASVFAQTMVYADTHRAFWSLRHTAPRFFGTALVLGLALALTFQPAAPLAVALLVATLLKLACELAVLKYADTDSDRWTQLRRTAVLQTGPLRAVLGVRLLAALVGGGFVPFLFAAGAGSTGLAMAALGLCLLGELAERYLFFTSVAPDKMPV